MRLIIIRINEAKTIDSVLILIKNNTDPEIAIAVIVENGGSGSSVAAPIASQVIQAHLASLAAENHQNTRNTAQIKLDTNSPAEQKIKQTIENSQ